MASYDERDRLVPENEHGVVRFSEVYCSGDLKYIEDIAKGGMSRISLFYLESDGYRSKVVVKRLFQKIVTDRELKYLRTEVDILTSVDHRNIIRTYGIANIESEYGLVLEYLPNGSCTEFFNNFWDNEGKTKEVEEKIAPLKTRIIGEVINAMEYLHLPRKLLSSPKEKSTLHLDLKGENVLLDQDLHAKICDFGLSMMSTLTRLRSSTTIHRGVSGTPGFIAPERLQNPNCKPSTKCDVYSFGILEYAILTDSPPYPDYVAQNLHLLEHYIVEKNCRPDISKISSIFPNDLIAMMEECWSGRPNSRPSFRELAIRITAIKEQIPDFEEKARDSVNIIKSMISNVPIIRTLPDLLPQSTESGRERVFDSTRRHGISGQTPTPSADTAAITDVMDSAGDSDAMSDRDSNSSVWQFRQPTTFLKEPISCRHDDRPTPRNVRQSTTVVNSPSLHYEEDDSLLVPASSPLVIDVERHFCSVTKILLSVSTIVIFAAALTIALVIPLIHNSNNAGGTCPPVRKPDHGHVTCKNQTKTTAAECHFSCDSGYEVMGPDTIVCSGGRWTKRDPSCEIACKLPGIPNGIVKCTNQTFEHSACNISCTNHHIIQGKAVITCLDDGNWSAPVPACVCPKCRVGDNCENSISWQDVANNLEAMQPYGTIPVNYGGKIFVCSTELHSIKFDWIGICVDKGTGTKMKCGTNHVSPAGAADAAAAELIRDLVNRKIFLEPCDASRMPTEC